MHRKILVIVGVCVFSLPAVSSAQVTSINGLTDPVQALVTPGSSAQNSMHMDIIQVGTDKHRFRWDGTPWRVDQGGTGVLTLPSALLVGNGTSSIVSASVLSPLTFDSNSLGCQLATSTQDGCLSAADWVRFDEATQGGGGGSPAGSNNEIQFNDNGAFGSNSKFVFDPETGFLGVGTSTKYSLRMGWNFVSETTGPAAGKSIHVTNYGDNAASGAGLTTASFRGTIANPQPVILNDTLGYVAFNGFNGQSLPVASPTVIVGYAGENWSPTAWGAGMRFLTTANGGTARTEKMSIEPSGNVRIATGSLLLNQGDLTVNTGMASIKSDLRVEEGNVRIMQGNLRVPFGNAYIGVDGSQEKMHVHGTGFSDPLSGSGYGDSGHVMKISSGPTANSGGALNIGVQSDYDVWLQSFDLDSFAAEHRNLLLNVNGGNVGVGTDDPQSRFTVQGDVRIERGTNSNGGCLIMKDSDGSGYTYITANDGVLSASDQPCN